MSKKANEAARYTGQQARTKPGAAIFLGNGLDRAAASIKASSIAEPKLTETILDVVARL